MKSLIVLLLISFLAACSGDNSDANHTLTLPVVSGPHPLEGQWKVTEITSQAGVNQTDYLHDGYTLTIDQNGELEGSADCNFFFGEYSYNDEQSLSVGQLSTTRAACPLPSAWSLYIGVLQSARHYERMADRLIITGVLDGRLVFERLAAN